LLTRCYNNAKAFAKLGDSTIQGLLKDKDKLSDILLYHVVPGRVLRKDLKNEVIKAANGDNIRTGVTRRPTRVLINNNVRVTRADVLAKNGVINFIDEVLIPPGNLLDTIKGEQNLSTLAAAVKAAKLESTLRDMKSDLTIFAPTNKAFEKLAVNQLIKNPEKLKSILLYHAVSGSVLRSALRGDSRVKTLQGSNIHFDEKGRKLFINDSEVTEANILASNGVIHVIDEVLEIP
jgi:transforming growth factor-beta-induced protein